MRWRFAAPSNSPHNLRKTPACEAGRTLFALGETPRTPFSFLTFGVIAVFAGMLIAVLGAAGASKSQDAASIIIAALIAFVFSAVIFFLGAFILRIWCEIIIVIFSIHEELAAIEKVLRENR